MPTRKVASSPGGAGAGASLHRGAAAGVRSREAPPSGRQAQHSTSVPAQRPAESRRPADLSIRPTRPSRALAARATPSRHPRHPPRSERAPAAWAPPPPNLHPLGSASGRGEGRPRSGEGGAARLGPGPGGVRGGSRPCSRPSGTRRRTTWGPWRGAPRGCRG